MASNHIELQGNESRLAGKFRSLVDRTTDLQDEMKRMKLIMDEAGASTGDWASIQALFGFVDAVTAQAAYLLLSGAAQKINSSAIDDFVNRIG
jgi:hypothetical protein